MFSKIVLSLIFAVSLFGSTYTFHDGHTYKIKEINIVKLIKQYIAKHHKQIQMKINKEMKEARENLLHHYKPANLTITLPHAARNSIFYTDPEYTLKRTIKGPNGKVLYPKGYTFNPLHYITLRHYFVFFDASSKKQVQWVIKHKFNQNLSVMLIVTNGNVFSMKKKLHAPVFYATNPIINRFGIRATPSVAFQDGDMIEVKQFKLQ